MASRTSSLLSLLALVVSAAARRQPLVVEGGLCKSVESAVASEPLTSMLGQLLPRVHDLATSYGPEVMHNDSYRSLFLAPSNEALAKFLGLLPSSMVDELTANGSLALTGILAYHTLPYIDLLGNQFTNGMSINTLLPENGDQSKPPMPLRVTVGADGSVSFTSAGSTAKVVKANIDKCLGHGAVERPSPACSSDSAPSARHRQRPALPAPGPAPGGWG